MVMQTIKDLAEDTLVVIAMCVLYVYFKVMYFLEQVTGEQYVLMLAAIVFLGLVFNYAVGSM